MDEIKQAAAFLFRRAAAGELEEDAFVRHASLDLHWLSPKDARRFLEAARALGYVGPGSNPGRVALTFDARQVDVPLDFRFDASALDGAPSGALGIVEELVRAAARARGVGEEEVAREVARTQEDKLLEAPVAAALVAAAAGVELAPYFARIREALARTGRSATPSSS